MNPDNSARLKRIMTFFGISVTQIARYAQVSRSYASGVVNGRLKPKPSFFINLERSLGNLVDEREHQIFMIDPIPQGMEDELVR